MRNLRPIQSEFSHPFWSCGGLIGLHFRCKHRSNSARIRTCVNSRASLRRVVRRCANKQCSSRNAPRVGDCQIIRAQMHTICARCHRDIDAIIDHHRYATAMRIINDCATVRHKITRRHFFFTNLNAIHFRLQSGVKNISPRSFTNRLCQEQTNRPLSHLG